MMTIEKPAEQDRPVEPEHPDYYRNYLENARVEDSESARVRAGLRLLAKKNKVV